MAATGDASTYSEAFRVFVDDEMNLGNVGTLVVQSHGSPFFMFREVRTSPSSVAPLTARAVNRTTSFGGATVL